MSQLSISLLGTVQITRHGQSVTNQAYAKVIGLLAYLAVEADRPHMRASLATLFWPEQTDERARHSLRQALSTLRRVLDDPISATPYLLITRDAVQFNRDADYELDVRRVIDLWAACDHHAHRRLETCAACANRLQQVVAQIRGEFLAGFSIEDSAEFEDWVQVWRQRMHHKAIEAISTIAAWQENRGALDLAVAALVRQLELDPWQESTHRKLMELLWRSGKRTEAMTQYERCRKILDEELGVEPEVETSALYELISAPDSTPHHVPAWPSSTVPTRRLPAPAGRLVGRDRDLEAIADLLANQDCRLLTLIGPGGSGKTRLAIQLACDQSEYAPGSVCFVDLASIQEPNGLVPAIAEALGLTLLGDTDPQQQLLDWIRDRSLFLVLDNLEHLLEDMHLVPHMLAAAPEITILTTSRERLQLQGEWVYEVHGLDVPTGDATDSFEGYGSVELFNERLRQVRPRVPLQHEERPTVARICQMVEGMPLAIELAAAWAQTLTLEQIADGIRKNLDFLSTSLRDVPSRHQSMRAVFNQTWQMLSIEEQDTYRRLSVFRDGFRLEAAESIADASSFQLAALVGKSLVTQQASGRFRIHGLLAQYGEELAQQDESTYTQLNDRHCTYYLERLAGHEEELIGRDQRTTLDDIEGDIGNVRKAWKWATSQRSMARIESAAHALWLFYAIRGWMREGAFAFGSVLDELDADPDTVSTACVEMQHVHASLLVRYGGFKSGLGRYDEGIALLNQGMAILQQFGDRRQLGLTLNMLAAAHRMKGNFAEAKRLLEESLDHFQHVGDAWGVAFSLNDLGLMSHLLGDGEVARVCCEEGRVMFREIGDRRGHAFAAYNLGMIASRNGEHERARRLYRESLAMRQDSHDQWGIAASLVQLGSESRALGQPHEARALFLKALRIAWNSSVTPVVLDALVGLSELLIDEGDPKQAHKWLVAVAAHSAIPGQLQAELDQLKIDPTAEEVILTDRGAIDAVNDIARILAA